MCIRADHNGSPLVGLSAHDDMPENVALAEIEPNCACSKEHARRIVFSTGKTV